MSKQIVVFAVVVLSFVGCVDLSDPSKLAYKGAKILEKVEQRYREKIKHAPSNNQHKQKLAKFFYDQKRFSEAEAELQKIKENSAQVLLAKCYAKQHKETKAISLFQRLELKADKEAQYIYANSLVEKNLFPEAKRIYQDLKETEFHQKAVDRLNDLSSKTAELKGEVVSRLDDSLIQEKYPDSDSALVFSKEVVEITEDNKSVYSVHALIKILNERGRDRWAELHLGYDSTYEHVDLEYARTITPDRVAISAGKESIRDVSRYTNFPLYSNSRVLIVSLPQVTVGSYIEYKAKIYKSKLMNGKDYSMIYRLLESYPVVESELIIKFPKDRSATLADLNKKYLEDTDLLKVEEKVEEECKIYKYKFKNLKRLLPESKMPSLSKITPALVFSTFRSWNEFYGWWDKLYKDKLVVTTKMKEFLLDLIKDAKSDYDKARLIYEFCSQKIRYVAIEYGDAGFEPHFAEEVFFNRYGDCKDQAILLVALLREAGLKAYPVLIPTEDAYNLRTEIVASYFNHAIAAVKLDENLIFMDPTSSTASFNVIPMGDQARNVMVFYEDNFEIVTTPQQEINELYIQMQIEIDDDAKANIRRRLEYKGFYASGYRYYYKETPPSLIKDSLLRKARSMASLAELKAMQIDNIEDHTKLPVLEYSFSAPDFLSNAGDLRIVPVLSESVPGASFIDRDKRKYPLDMSGLFKLKSDISLILPDNLSVVYLPDDLVINTAWGEFTIKFKQVLNVITFSEVFKTKNRFIEPDDYSDFKNKIEEILQKSKKQIILKVT